MTLFSETKKPLLFLILLYSPSLLILAAVGAASIQTGVSPFKFMRDPAQIANVHPFTGIVSNLGALLWCAAGAICLFSWTVLRNRREHGEFPRFLLYAGLLTILLLIDDFFCCMTEYCRTTWG